MNNLMKLSIAAVIALGASALVLIKYQQQAEPHDKHTLTIGILQTATHPALDAARKGFVETLEHALSGKVNLIIRNAEGSIPMAHTIAQSLNARDVDAIYAIATPAAQAVASIAKNKPIIIAAVTDPESAGLCGPESNICGCSDMIDIQKTIELLQELIPTAQTVAIVYNSGEINSQIQADKMQAILRARALTPIILGITSEADVAAAIISACHKADVLLVPNDNIVGSSIQLAASLALKNNKAIIACANTFVEQGALAARGVDYYATGVQAAQHALAVLVNGTKPATLSVAHPAGGTITINKKVADALGVTIPEALQKNSVLIN